MFPMFRKTNLVCTVVMMLFWKLIILSHKVLVDASFQNTKDESVFRKNALHKDHSSNEILEEENIKPKFMGEQHYYLPMQSTYDGRSVFSDGVSVTSPPHLAIEPAPIRTSYEEIIATQSTKQNQPNYDDCVAPYSSHCVLETPSMNKLQSHLLMPSETLVKESLILSGHIEVPPKTTDDFSASKNTNVVSAPSIVIQGTLSNL